LTREEADDEGIPPALTMLNDGKDTFVVVDGVTIAKRGLLAQPKPGLGYR
jgi:hypothetical protein